MSVEGMWAIYMGDIESPASGENSGVLVLETGRVFGGDSAMAYLGKFEVRDGLLYGDARCWSYNPFQGDMQNVFGLVGKLDTHVALIAKPIDETRYEGAIWMTNAPDAKLPCLLQKISELA